MSNGHGPMTVASGHAACITGPQGRCQTGLRATSQDGSEVLPSTAPHRLRHEPPTGRTQTSTGPDTKGNQS